MTSTQLPATRPRTSWKAAPTSWSFERSFIQRNCWAPVLSGSSLPPSPSIRPLCNQARPILRLLTLHVAFRTSLTCQLTLATKPRGPCSRRLQAPYRAGDFHHLHIFQSFGPRLLLTAGSRGQHGGTPQRSPSTQAMKPERLALERWSLLCVHMYV